VGSASIVRAAYPDPTAFDVSDVHYDAKSDPGNPRWFVVDIRLDAVFPSPLSLELLRKETPLKDMELLRRGSRLSVQPVKKTEFDAILKRVARR
jgi:predicted RNA-binding protein with PUA-like domain